MTWLNWDVTEHHWKHQWTDLELINTQQKKEWEYPESNTLTWIWNATKQREGRNNQEKKKEKFFQNSMLCPIRWHSCIESEHSKRMKDRDVWTNQDVARLFYCQATLLWGQTLKVPHICLCYNVFYTSRLWQCCGNVLYGLNKSKLCECNNTQQSFIVQNYSVYLPCMTCNHNYTAVFIHGNTNKKTIVLLPWKGKMNIHVFFVPESCW